MRLKDEQIGRLAEKVLGDWTKTDATFNYTDKAKKRGPLGTVPLDNCNSLRLVVGSGPHSEFPIRWASVDRFRQFPRNGGSTPRS